jgi:hypothetical protein
MSSEFQNIGRYLVQSAHHADANGSHKLAGVVYIVVGFFLAPALIGVPLIVYGVYKLFK